MAIFPEGIIHPAIHPPDHIDFFCQCCAVSPPCTGSLFWCAVSPAIGPLFRKYVRCPPSLLAPCSENMCGVPPSLYILFLCGVPPPQFSSVPWTLCFCLGFWAKVPACKMKPSSTCILECGTPSWACLFCKIDLLVQGELKPFYRTPSKRRKMDSVWYNQPNFGQIHSSYITYML